MQGSRGGRIKITPTILFLRLDTLNKLSVRLKGAAERLPESTWDQWCLMNLHSDQTNLLSFKSKLPNSPNGTERNGSIRRSPKREKLPSDFSPRSAYNPHDRFCAAISAAVEPKARSADARLSSLKSELNMGGACHSEHITVNGFSSLERTRSIQTLDSHHFKKKKSKNWASYCKCIAMSASNSLKGRTRSVQMQDSIPRERIKKE